MRGSPPEMVIMLVPRRREMVDAADHLVEGHGFGDFVVLVAVGAGEIAPAHGHNLGHDGMAGGAEGVNDEGDFPHLA